MSKLKVTAITLLVLGVLLLAIGATFPAHVAWDYARPELEKRGTRVELNGIEGTVWRGSAKQAVVNGVSLGKLQWTLSAAALLGAPTVNLKLNDPGLDVDAVLIKNSAGLQVRDTQIKADAAWLAPALGIPALTPTGEIHLALPELLLDLNGIPQSAKATLEWNNAGVAGFVSAKFGNYRMTLEPLAGKAGFSGRVFDRDLDTPLSLQGEFQLEGVDYRANVVLTPNAGHPLFNSSISSALQYIGQPNGDASGARLLSVQGRLLLGSHAAQGN
jgi:Type II secretion system (T2SS), protein N